MDEFPTAEEEFELIYDDELEVLRDQGDVERTPKKSRKSLDFTPYIKETDTSSQDLHENLFSPLIPDETPNNNKRTIEDLFGDIDDLLYENQAKSKKHKGDEHEDDYALIDHILELRRLAKKRDMPEMQKNNFLYRDTNNLSYTVPKYPFVGATRHDGRRVYIRCHSEQFEAEERLRIIQQINLSSDLGNNKQMWDDARELIEKQLQNKETKIQTSNAIDDKLWVDLYKPSKYSDLLSNEVINVTLLKWLKLWDRYVFNRKPKLKMTKIKAPDPKMQEYSQFDDNGRPFFKIALLGGPPGVGKTTLAHIVARHAGYNVVEVNASDNQSSEAFKTILENATQMKSVIDKDQRPNCLIFDEIDQAPSSSIDFLVKFINGMAVKNKKKQKESFVLKRPIICICNDLYVPHLRPLRDIAFKVNFVSPFNHCLAERLMDIAKQQQIKTDLGAMSALVEKSHNDIRSCLSVLRFYKSQNRPLNLSDINKTSIGQKDIQKGLFSVWEDIFFINTFKAAKESHMFKSRMDKILNVVSSCGDYIKIAQGIFEIYPDINYKNSNFTNTCQALDWFCYNDIMNSCIYSLQDYSLSNYLQYAFVAWHFVFSTKSSKRLQYPNVGYKVKTKQNRQKAIVAEVIRGIQRSIRPYVNPLSLILDILPLLSIIIVPSLRPITLHLYTEEEKKTFDHVVKVMVDYNLNYVQEKNADGGYIYKLDPNIEENVSFIKRNTLSYCNKQMIAKEISMAKLHKFEEVVQPQLQKPSELPNHLQTLKAKTVEMPELLEAGSSKESSSSGKLELKNDIWYQYKEGYNNAIRKYIKVATLK